jgi:hypothetical protein
MKRVMLAMACVLAIGLATPDLAGARHKGKNCHKLCKTELKGCKDECTGLKGRAKRDCRKECKSGILATCEASSDSSTCLPSTTTTTSTSTSTTSTTSPYGSASRAFLDPVVSLLE